MPVLLLQDRSQTAFSRETVFKDFQIAARIRMTLALAGLLTVFLENHNVGVISHVALNIFAAYVVFSGIICVASEWNVPAAMHPLMPLLDCLWCAVLVYLTGGSDSFLFLYFLLPVLVTSLSRGFDDGARVAVLAVLFYGMASIAARGLEYAPLLFRASGLLALGYLMARLGENRRQLQRQMELLQALTRVANPHFGADRTITAMLERTRAFFNAERCVTVARVEDRYSMRCVAADSPLSVLAEPLDAQVGQALLSGPPGAVLLHRRSWRNWFGTPGCTRAGESVDRIAELLDAGSFVAAPATLHSGSARVFVVRADAGLTRSDAMFLAQVVAQATPVVENLALLDRLATTAASVERKKFALNLHDSAVQPYIGLTLGLAALRKKAGPSNPLAADLDRLVQMAESVIAELRAFARTVRSVPESDEPLCLHELRRQAEQIERRFGIHVSVQAEGRLAFGDRISAEVVQIVREGLSNICRHTHARRGVVQLRCDEAQLRIVIDNENAGAVVLPFVPRSISERAAALGGRAYVRQGAVDSTAVCVEIPI